MRKGIEIIPNRQNKSEIHSNSRTEASSPYLCRSQNFLLGRLFVEDVSLCISAVQNTSIQQHIRKQNITLCAWIPLTQRYTKHIHPTARQKTEYYPQCLDSHNTVLYKIHPSNNTSENRTLHSVSEFLLHRAVANTACNVSPQRLSYRDFKFSLLPLHPPHPHPPYTPASTCLHYVCVCVCEHVACKEHTIMVLYYFWGYMYIFYNLGVLTFVSNILFSRNARYYYYYPYTAEAKKDQLNHLLTYLPTYLHTQQNSCTYSLQHAATTYACVSSGSRCVNM